MATSGTFAFNLDIGEAIEEAFENIGVELRTGYDYKTARRSIDLLTLEWFDQNLTRVSISQYSHLSNKLSQSKPLQYYVERTPTGIVVNLWPSPDDQKTYTFGYYYMERIEDSGKPASNNMDIPARYLPCLIAGLANWV